MLALRTVGMYYYTCIGIIYSSIYLLIESFFTNEYVVFLRYMLITYHGQSLHTIQFLIFWSVKSANEIHLVLADLWPHPQLYLSNLPSKSVHLGYVIFNLTHSSVLTGYPSNKTRPPNQQSCTKNDGRRKHMIVLSSLPLVLRLITEIALILLFISALSTLKMLWEGLATSAWSHYSGLCRDTLWGSSSWYPCMLSCRSFPCLCHRTPFILIQSGTGKPFLPCSSAKLCCYCCVFIVLLCITRLCNT